MAKVILEVTAEGTLVSDVSDLKTLERLFRLGEALEPGLYIGVPKTHPDEQLPQRYIDLSNILRIPEHMAAFDWKVRSMVITDDGKHSVIYHQVVMTLEEYRLLMSSFGFRGSCACDGATSDGCPLCNEEKTREWKDTLDRVKNSFK
jgi:hypothetical protein